MNEIQQPKPRIPEDQTPETLTIAKQRSLADRILAYSVIGSLFVNLGWLAWVSNSDLFGSAANLADLKPQLIKIVKPPIPVKPKPRKKEPPPPPPKQKPPPKVKPLKQIKPPPPRPQPRQPRPSPPVKQVAVAHTNNAFAKPTFEAPPPAPNTELGKPTYSGEAPVAPPTQAAPTPDPVPTPKPAPPAPPPPAPPAPVVEKPKPPPPPPPPKPKIPDRDEPQIIGSFTDFSLPQFDASTLNTTSVTVTWAVDERGHPRNIKFRPTGNSDVDDAIRNAIQGFRFKPAVHNGVAETATLSHTFALE